MSPAFGEQQQSISKSTPFKIAVIYLLVGGLWILFSDQLLTALINDLTLLTRLQTLKGWLFILISGLVLYALVRRNIATLKHSEAALRESEGKFRALLESAAEAIVVVNREGRIVLFNKKAEEMFGYNRKELLGQTIEMLLSERFHSAHVKHRANYLADLRTRPMGIDFELAGRRRDGSEFPLEISLSYAKTADDVLVMSAITDITARIAAQHALAQSEEQYRRFFEEDLTGNFIATADGELLACNPTFVHIFGFASNDAALQANLFSLYPDAEAARELLASLRQEKKLEYYETELRNQEDKPVYVVANVIGSFDDKGELAKIRGYIFDDTKRKKLEEQFFQSQKMEAIGNLAGGISHDFNNLLSAIVLYSEMLLDDLPPADPMRSHLEEIMKAIDRSSALTRQLLVFSRTHILETTILELNDVVVDMEKMLRRLIGEDIELSTALSPERGQVKANAGHIEQIIMNLVVNARDAMPNGGQIIIETANVDIDETYAQQHLGLVPGACVMLAVSDTGCGMDAETQSHIFEPFFTTKTPGKGTGLGLSTVYGIVKQCGGQISVYSEIDRGTTFKIYLPRIEQTAAAAKRESALLQTPRGAETILLVEDEDVVRNLTRLVLVKAGYNVLEAHNGEEALQVHERYEGAIHLMVTDVVMPKMGGGELAEPMAQLYPATKIIYMTAYTDKIISHHGVVGPVTAFLQKPFTKNALLLKVREVLDTN